MRVLMLHNRYLVPGGEDQSTEAEVRLLRAAGHHVALLEEDNAKVQEIGKLRTALRTIWSHASYRLVRSYLHGGDFDVVHVQNAFPLFSPSVYYAAWSQGVPVVQSLRNYRLACVNGLYFRRNQVCLSCEKSLIPWRGIGYRCYRESAAGSAVVAGMLGTHKLLRTFQSKVQMYIALTEFARDKFVSMGLPEDRITVKPNFVNCQVAPGDGSGNYALFVGRLSNEKGIQTLIKAWSQASPLPLWVVGHGPLEMLVRDCSFRSDRIRFLGSRQSSEVTSLMQRASFLMFPSECFEGMPRTIIEAFAVGTPVIAANIGAAASMVQHVRTGLHFKPGSSEDLAAQVKRFLSDPELASEMRRNARLEYEAKYTPERNIAMLEEVYRRARAVMHERSVVN